jgi:cytochrome P450
MPYVEATLLEIQRCANVLPLTFRGAARDTTLAGYNIPKVVLLESSSISYD